MIIYNISGKAESGKDSFFKIVEKYYKQKGVKICHMLFARHIKQYAKEYFGWDGVETTKPRKLLQIIGTDIIRNQMKDPNFHTRRLIEDINILKNYFDVFVITDCRFLNEVELIKEVFGSCVKTIRIERPNHVSKLTDEQRNHESETALDNYTNWDYVIDNNGTLDEFKIKLDNIMSKLERI